jgi:hypothetical protein
VIERRIRVLEVGHEPIGTRVERVDRHLAVRRTGDLDPTLLHVSRCGRDRPVALADLARLAQKVKRLTRGKPRAPLHAGLQQLGAARIEVAVQFGDELERVRREDVVEGAVVAAPEFQRCVCSHWSVSPLRSST